ncbi:transcriptional activator NhaR [Lacisediminimonas profundi]|uniref:transcriptional activator NhaR n=1 Tax=Lacisediminimonas profundi TaxID=2603856 RepID=UPI00124AF695|nr:transcriptional activator NhaR [Lacisediminimonas profundi]
MASINYKHLRYFWMVAKAGSIVRASEQLFLSPQSISGQLRELEESLGVALFHKVGRQLELTDAGRRALTYADGIFSLGEELVDAMRDQTREPVVRFKLGVADSVPKLIAFRVVEPTLYLDEPVHLICREGRLDALLSELAVHRLDMVIADRPIPNSLNVRGYSHLLGESGLTVFGAPRLLEKLPKEFPAMLERAPFLLPGAEVLVRSKLLQWFAAQKLRPRIVGEFDDSALLGAFAQAGVGLFVAPSAIADYVCAQYNVRAVGDIAGVKEQLYGLTTERRLTHPAIVAIRRIAQQEVFGKRAPAVGAV